MSRANMRRRTAISVVLALAWLPYSALPCLALGKSHLRCGSLPAVEQPPVAEAHHHAHAAAAAQQHDHSGGHQGQAARCCCRGPGQCDIKVTSDTLSCPPAQLIAALPLALGAAVPAAERLHASPSAPVAHAPPRYLTTVVLLI